MGWERLGRTDVKALLKLPSELLLQDDIFRRETLFGILHEVAEMQDRPVHKFTVVEDLAGWSWEHMRILRRLQRIVKVYEDHCPEVLKRVIVVNPPSMFSTLWNVGSTVLDEGTRRKFVVAPPAKGFQTILKYVPEDSIP